MRGVLSLYVWIPVEAPLVCGADRHGSTARRTHEEEKVEPVRSTTSSTSTRATSREFLRLLSVFFRCAVRRVVTIYDLILEWFLVYAIENFDLCYRSLRVSQHTDFNAHEDITSYNMTVLPYIFIKQKCRFLCKIYVYIFEQTLLQYVIDPIM